MKVVGHSRGQKDRHEYGLLVDVPAKQEGTEAAQNQGPNQQPRLLGSFPETPQGRLERWQAMRNGTPVAGHHAFSFCVCVFDGITFHLLHSAAQTATSSPPNTPVFKGRLTLERLGSAGKSALPACKFVHTTYSTGTANLHTMRP